MSITSITGSISYIAATIFFLTAAIVLIKIYCCYKQQYHDIISTSDETEKEGTDNEPNQEHY